MKILSSTLSVGEIRRAARTSRTQAKAILKLGVTSLKNNTIKPCKGKLNSLRRSYAVHNENEFPPRLGPPSMMRRITVIDIDQGLPLMNPSHMKKSIIVNTDAKAPFIEDWVMMR